VIEPGVERPRTKESAHAWEQECLAELKRMVDHLRGKPHEPRISEVYLDGECPQTRICVRFWNRSLKEEQTKCYELWGPSFEAPRGLETPDQVALLVHTWILESH
jgi:hypothetical protein